MNRIISINGPLVIAKGKFSIFEVVRVGEEKLIGEVIGIENDKAYIQVYEDTNGLKVGEPVFNTGKPLTIELGPGLLANIFDGLGRPLKDIYEKTQSIYIPKGIDLPTLDRKKVWEFIPKKKKGDTIKGGDIIGTVNENGFEHRIIVPPNVEGKIEEIYEGNFTIEETIAIVNGKPIKLYHEWPIRKPRPYKEKLDYNYPFITGTRVLDIMFPIAKGGSAAVPGPFGSGKTVLNQQIAKWADSDIVIYIGCGERGNEMTEVLEEFPKLKDPKTGKPLMYRTILIANTSNMPIAAREASIYLGATIGEYFRDQGYSVVVNADSTSRWAEALREISSRLGEIPSEEGYPAYLLRKLAEFYERSGRVRTLNDLEGSLTIIGAVSPPGGDFSEPVTQNTLRLVGALWALDSKLAYKRHYPAINYLISYTKQWEFVKKYFEELYEDVIEIREEFFAILKRESELMDIVSIVGPDALSDNEKIYLHMGRIIREGFLQQDAFDENDSYSPLEKTIELMRIIHKYYVTVKQLLGKIPLEEIEQKGIHEKIIKLRYKSLKEFREEIKAIEQEILSLLNSQ